MPRACERPPLSAARAVSGATQWLSLQRIPASRRPTPTVLAPPGAPNTVSHGERRAGRGENSAVSECAERILRKLRPGRWRDFAWTPPRHGGLRSRSDSPRRARGEFTKGRFSALPYERNPAANRAVPLRGYGEYAECRGPGPETQKKAPDSLSSRPGVLSMNPTNLNFVSSDPGPGSSDS
jgi:hypothetical protein